MNKVIHRDQEGRDQLIEGIRLFSDAVKSTLGPSGRTVILQGPQYIGGHHITKDGVTVARSIRFENKIHDTAALMLRQASEKTASAAGDGTTTSVVLAEAFINGFEKYYKIEHGSVIDVLRDVHKICDELIRKLDDMSIEVTGDMLQHVATISANNDATIGKLIADIFAEVDVVTVEDSKGEEVYAEIVTGLKLDRGYASRYFITDVKKQECVLDNPYILLFDAKIHDLHGMEHILAEIIKSNKSLLIVGTLEPNAMNAINYNVLNGNIKAAVIEPPSNGYRRDDIMRDLAYVLDAQYYSEETGDDLQMVQLEGLGRATKITITDQTTIIEPNPDAIERIGYRVADLKSEEPSDEIDIRLKAISGGFGVIHVGAPSSVEQKEIRDRVDDAVAAIRAAKEEGILPGGGSAILDAFTDIDIEAKDVAFEIVHHAVEAPLRQMLGNAGRLEDDIDDIVHQVTTSPLGYNVKTEYFEDLIETGVIDPTKVTKNAIRNSISVASTILSTNCIITESDGSTK